VLLPLELLPLDPLLVLDPPLLEVAPASALPFVAALFELPHAGTSIPTPMAQSHCH